MVDLDRHVEIAVVSESEILIYQEFLVFFPRRFVAVVEWSSVLVLPSDVSQLNQSLAVFRDCCAENGVGEILVDAQCALHVVTLVGG